LAKFIDNPTDKFLGDFLESIFGSINNPEKSKLDAGYVASFHERPTMAIFEVALKILLNDRLKQYTFSFDKSLGKGNQIKLDGYISTHNWEILMEAKKIITNDLVDEIGSESLSDEELKKLNINPKPYKNGYKFQFKWDEDGNDNKTFVKCETVGDVVRSAINQLTHYIRQMKSLDEFKNSQKQIKAFAYVHIMKNRYIIVEHKWNGKLFTDSDIKPK
jgi:hypothetical protein